MAGPGKPSKKSQTSKTSHAPTPSPKSSGTPVPKSAASPTSTRKRALALELKERFVEREAGRRAALLEPFVLGPRRPYIDETTFMFFIASGPARMSPFSNGCGPEGCVHLLGSHSSGTYVGLRFTAAPNLGYLIDCEHVSSSDILIIERPCRLENGEGKGQCVEEPRTQGGSATPVGAHHLLRFLPASSQPREIEARVVGEQQVLVVQCEIRPVQ